jgi:hypothetical protein
VPHFLSSLICWNKLPSVADKLLRKFFFRCATVRHDSVFDLLIFVLKHTCIFLHLHCTVELSRTHPCNPAQVEIVFWRTYSVKLRKEGSPFSSKSNLKLCACLWNWFIIVSSWYLELSHSIIRELDTFMENYVSRKTPWSRVLLEKLIYAQLVNKFSTFYGTRRFITVFTREARHRWCVYVSLSVL